MTKVDVGANVEGVGGGHVKVVTSFPLVLRPCETAVDKIPTKKKVIYVDHHSEKNGATTITEHEVKINKKKWGIF